MLKIMVGKNGHLEDLLNDQRLKHDSELEEIAVEMEAMRVHTAPDEKPPWESFSPIDPCYYYKPPALYPSEAWRFDAEPRVAASYPIETVQTPKTECPFEPDPLTDDEAYRLFKEVEAFGDVEDDLDFFNEPLHATSPAV